MKLSKIIRVITLALFLCIVVLEIAFRIIRKEQWVKNKYPKIYTADTIYGYTGIPNVEGEIRRPSIAKKFKLNNQGFYGPDFSTSKPDSIFRIIVAGASGVEGIWAKHKESFPQKLHRKFRINGYNVDVLNCGVSGNDHDYQNIQLIKYHLVRYNPDIILYEGRTQIANGNHQRDTFEDYSILFTGNNEQERIHSKYLALEKVKRIQNLKVFTDLWDISYIVRFFVRRSDSSKIPSFTNCMDIYVNNKAESWEYGQFTTYSFQESIDTLNNLNKILKNHNCKLILFDYNHSQKQQIFENKDKIDFCYIFLNLSGDDLGHQYDGHFNEKADEEIANQLFDKLSSNFVPPKYLKQRSRK